MHKLRKNIKQLAYLPFSAQGEILPVLGFEGVSTLVGHMHGIVVSALRLSVEKDKLINQLMNAQEAEKKRIAAELHDGIAQDFSAIKYSLENEIKKLSRSQANEETLQALDEIAQGMQDAIGELRRITMALRPAMLEDLGTLSTIDWFCRKYNNIHPQINVTKRYAIEESEIPQQLKVAIYRIVQEALNNTANHANADHVSLELEKTQTAIRLLIKDNGQGFDVLNNGNLGIKERVGLGLTTMRERAELTAGEFMLVSAVASGTSVEVCWPLVEHG